MLIKSVDDKQRDIDALTAPLARPTLLDVPSPRERGRLEGSAVRPIGRRRCAAGDPGLRPGPGWVAAVPLKPGVAVLGWHVVASSPYSDQGFSASSGPAWVEFDSLSRHH